MSSANPSNSFYAPVQNAQIGDHNTLNIVNVSPALKTFVLLAYEPIRAAITEWRLIEAERDLRSLLEKIIAASEDAATAVALQDLHQRLLLALGVILQRRGRRKEALEQWGAAKRLGTFNQDRRRQEMELLANLGETELLAEAVSRCPYYDPVCNDMKAILAWMQGNLDEAIELLPIENPNLDMRLLHIRILLSRLTESGAADVKRLLDIAWEQARTSSVFMAEIAGLTLNLLQRIVDSGWETADIDRESLLVGLRARVMETVDTWEALAASFPEGYVHALAVAAQFHLYLQESEALHAVGERIRQSPAVTRERLLTAYALKETWYDQATVTALEREGALAQVEVALLTAHLQDDSMHAQRTLRSALAHAVIPFERVWLVETLIQLLTRNEQIEDARQLLAEERERLPPEMTAVLEGAILLSQGLSSTVNHFRSELRRFPRSRTLLENQINLLRAQVHPTAEGGPSGLSSPDDLRREALACARRLVAILPSPEARFVEAYWISETGNADDALVRTRAVWQQGYRTRALTIYYADLLRKAENFQEAAEILGMGLISYPGDYELAWQCGTALALANEHIRAVEMLAPLLGHPEEGPELYINLSRAQLHAAATEPERASLAFDLLRDALRKFPAEPTLPARIVEAAQASNRMREAHHLLDAVDLSNNPHLRRATQEEVLTFVTAVGERNQMRRAFYETGGVPFSFLIQHMSRSAWRLWWARLATFKEQADVGTQTGASVIVHLPTITSLQPASRKLKRRLILDKTALLTLGTLGALQEVINALHAGKWTVYLFPDALSWLEQETSRLQIAQLPLVRQQYSQVMEMLQAARMSVTIHQKPTPDSQPQGEKLAHVLGPQAFDIAVAEAGQTYYLDDYVEPEATARFPADLLRSSRDLLAHIVDRGIVLPAQAERLRDLMPEIFMDGPPLTPIKAGRAIVVSGAALMIWHEAGLLSAWAAGGIGWPPLVIGPFAWTELKNEHTETQLYRESLNQCEAALNVVKGALRAKKLLPCPNVPRLRLKIGNLAEIWKPALELLAVASRNELVICADDLFMRLILDPRGLLGEDVGLRPVERQVRQRFPGVCVIGTTELLEQLASQQHLAAERAEDLHWQMFSYGYRGASLRGALSRLLHNVPLPTIDLSVPYQALIDALIQADTWLPSNAGSFRRAYYLRTAVMVIVQELLVEVWRSNTTMPVGHRAALADALLQCFERMAQP